MATETDLLRQLLTNLGAQPNYGDTELDLLKKVILVVGSGLARVTVASGKALTASNTLTLTGVDGSTLDVGAGGSLKSGAFAAAPIIVALPADEGRTSTTAFTDVAGFSFAVAAGQTWIVEATLFVTSAGHGGGFNYGIATPASTNYRGNSYVSDNNGNPMSPMFFTPFGGSGFSGDLTNPGRVINAQYCLTFTTSGTFSIQASQNTSNPITTYIMANSWMRAARVY